MDADSLVVTYDAVRGEPRSKKNSHDEATSDCVDCYRCVVVCPVGIDIRDGQQYQCINCGLCVDACNDIMTKLNKPLNLVRYDTLRNLTREEKGLSSSFKILRPRTIVYGAIVTILGAALLFGLLFKKQVLEFSVQPNRSVMFVKLSDGAIRNIYDLKIVNKSYEIDSVNLKIEGLENAKITIKPKYKVLDLHDGSLELQLKKNKISNFKVFIDAKEYSKKSNYQDLDFNFKADDLDDSYSTKFTHPNK